MSKWCACGRGGRFPERDLAGLCRGADRGGARPLRGGDQPGAAVAPYAQALAAALGHRAERAATRGASVACPPDHLLREVFETCRDFDEAKRRLETFRSRGRPSSRWSAANGRTLRHRAHRGTALRPAATRRRRPTTGCASTPPWEARVSSAVHDDAYLRGGRRQHPPAARGARRMGAFVRERPDSPGSSRRCSIRTRGSRSRCARRTARCGSPATRTSGGEDFPRRVTATCELARRRALNCSIEANAGLLNDLEPLVVFGLDEGLSLVRRHLHELAAVGLEARLELRQRLRRWPAAAGRSRQAASSPAQTIRSRNRSRDWARRIRVMVGTSGICGLRLAVRMPMPFTWPDLM